jgi:hypothetical protein
MNVLFKLNVLLIFVILLVQSCAKKPSFSDTPTVEFVSFSKTTLFQGSTFEDTTFLTLKFTDGDGDFGSDDSTRNIKIFDNRTGDLFTDFKTPDIPQDGANNGVQGTIRLMMFSTCCVYDDGTLPCDRTEEFPQQEINFDIYVTDKAGNKSNTITTPSWTLICNY